MKRWAVVHDLRPFGYRVKSKHGLRLVAQWRADSNRYYFVMPLADALAYNCRTEDMKEFDKELALYTDRTKARKERLNG